MNRVAHMLGGRTPIFAYVSNTPSESPTVSSVLDRAEANPFGSLKQAIDAAQKLADSISDDDRPGTIIRLEPGEYDL